MKESTKNAIFTLVSAIFAGLVIVFLAVPNVSFGASIGSLGGSTESSGFDFYESGTDFMKAMLIITAIVACAMVVVGILKFIVDLGKLKSLSTITTLLFKILAIALFVSALMYMISVIVMCNDNSFSSDLFGATIGGGLKPVYWSIILMPVFGLFSAGCAFATSITSKKKKRK